MNSFDRPVVLVLGPTAGGKSALSVAMAQRLPGGGECLSADSMQVYRGMDIGTAKVSLAERQVVPHHLIDLADPADDHFTVDRWLSAAEEAIAAIRARGRWPIMVGGTNFYVQAFLFGLFDGPPADRARRETLEALSDEALDLKLREVDPESAARLHVRDRRRRIRALEVFESTGKPLSEHQTQWSGAPRGDVIILALQWEVPAINRRINARVKEMMHQGLLEETRQLWQGKRLGRQAREALGYRQLIDHLEGRMTLEKAVEEVKIRTRRFAKQQRTWLRRFRVLPGVRWIACGEDPLEDIVDQALTMIADA